MFYFCFKLKTVQYMYIVRVNITDGTLYEMMCFNFFFQKMQVKIKSQYFEPSNNF